jgi:hypothetical protein
MAVYILVQSICNCLHCFITNVFKTCVLIGAAITSAAANEMHFCKFNNSWPDVRRLDIEILCA